MVKEIPFLNGNLSVYSCFIDVLYDLRRVLALRFDVFGRFYLRERIHDPVSVTRIAFEDKISIRIFRKIISLTMVLSMFIHNITLKHNRETTEFNLFHASLLRRVVGEFHFSL